MKSETRTLKAANEDAIGLNNELAFVFDGATALISCPEGFGPSWLSNTLKDLMLESASGTLFDRLENACSILKSRAPEMNEKNMPVCTLAAVMKYQDQLQWASLGDSPMLIETEQGILRIENQFLESLEKKAIDLMKLESEKNSIPFFKARACSSVSDLLKAHRKFQNAENGYGIFTLNRKWIRFIETGSVPLDSVSRILIMSDGFALLQKYLNLDDQEFLDWMKDHENQAMDICEKYLQNDIDGKVERIKIQDDLSFVFINDPDWFV